MSEHESFQFILVRDRQQNGRGLAIASDDHRSFVTLPKVGAQARLDVCDGSNLHPINSSPPISKRFRSFWPTAMTIIMVGTTTWFNTQVFASFEFCPRISGFELAVKCRYRQLSTRKRPSRRLILSGRASKRSR